jgi:hypothetical protein
MKPLISGLLLFSVFFTLTGCKRQAHTGPPVMLDSGTGALLIVFDRVAGADRETWLSQITLIGNTDTKTLPRITLADQQSLIVLDIPAGFYSVVTQAWLRKNPPHAGGSLSGVEIKAGQLTVLKGVLLTGEERFQPMEPLQIIRAMPWTLSRTEDFHVYIADIIKSSVKG